MASLVVMTGLTMNLMPSRNVINTEKPPIAREGTRLASQLPTTVNPSTLAHHDEAVFHVQILTFLGRCKRTPHWPERPTKGAMPTAM